MSTSGMAFCYKNIWRVVRSGWLILEGCKNALPTPGRTAGFHIGSLSSVALTATACTSRSRLAKFRTLHTHCSPSRAIRSAHCCLSCLSVRCREPTMALYSSTSPARTGQPSPLFYNGLRSPWLLCLPARSKIESPAVQLYM